MINILSFSAITANTREEVQLKQSREANNVEFWKYFSNKIKGRSVLFQKEISPKWGKGNLGSGSSLRGVSYGIIISRRHVSCVLYIHTAIKNENKKIFDLLEGFKDEIEEKIGKKLDWKRKDNIRSCGIYLVNTGVNVYQPKEWPKITEFLIEEINHMEQAFNPYLKTIALEMKAKGGNL